MNLGCKIIGKLCVLLLGICFPTIGQNFSAAEMKFDRIGVQQGLSQSSVLSIFQDSYGFLWFGTRDGLNRYDGYDFEVYKYQVNKPHSLGGSTVSEIREDSAGDLWLITENGLSYFNRKSSTFQNFILPKEQYEFTLFNALLIDQKGQIWVGGRYGLFLFDPIKEEFHRAGNTAFQFLGMISSLAEDQRGNIYVGSSRLGLHLIDQEHKLIKIELETPHKVNARVEAIWVDGDSIWTGTYGDGLFLHNLQGKLINHYHTNAAIQAKLSNNNIRCLLLDHDGTMWVGTFDGLNIITPKQEVIEIAPQLSDERSLAHSSIRSLFKDQKGSIWIGTYQGGLCLFDANLQRFNHQYFKPGNPWSLSYDVVGAFASMATGDILIGTERGGLNSYDSKTKAHQAVKPDGTIKSLLVDHEDKIWVGIFREGLQYYQRETKRFLKYPSSDQTAYSFLKQAIINHMSMEGENGIWLGTDSQGGLFYFDLKRRKFIDYEGQEELQQFLKNYPVKSIVNLGKDKLLLGTKGRGLVIFDKLTGNFEHMESLIIDGVHVQIDEVNHTLVDRQGKIWIASNGDGVIKYDPKNQTFSRFHTGDGLSNDVVWGSLEDDAGQLWFICFNGISKLTINEGKLSFKNYSYTSGFPLTEMNEGAFFKIPNGEFLIGGINGYVKFDPLTLKDSEYIPPVNFTNLMVSNKKVLPGDDTGILENNIYQTQKITLTYFQPILTIDFAALNFIRPENNQYSYQLKGFNEDWVQAGNRRSVTYTSLPDGRYTFLVKGSNNDNIWNEVPASLEVVILPPPWKTWWATCIYAILIVLGFLVIRKNAVKSTQMKNTILLEQLEKEKWKGIHDLKLKYFIDVSHEFRTPLTLILSPLEEVMERGTGDAWLKSRLKIMFFNAKRLIHLIDQILEIREIETGHHQVNSNVVMLRGLFEEIVDSFKGLADKKKIKLIDNIDKISDRVVILDHDKVVKIVFNLLSNAFKFTPDGGEIEVEVTEKEDSFRFRVNDNGRGIGKESIPKVFDRFFKEGKDQYGAGIGLSLTHSLITVLQGEIDVQSTLGKGTTFTVELPLKINHESDVKIENKAPFVKPVPLEYQQTSLVGNINEEEQEKPILLIVEDNVELKKFLKDQFKSKYEVITAKNGKSGLNKIMKSGPAIVISDVMMPEMDGIELCRHVKSNEALCHTPVILLTAKNAHQNRIEGLDYGADDYISKPFNIQELQAKVKSILKNRTLVQQKYRGKLGEQTAHLSLDSQDDQLMHSVISLIEEKLDQPNLTVDFLSQEIGISRVHLFRKIKALTGLTPSELIKESRMKKAMKMLSSGKYRVSDVAYEVGFQDVAYFGKVFKKQFGQKPSDIKKEE
ncbi:response regulator [Belliella sp. DSM 111904]|uniref:histidine kinase n=1 Tax=Belliella filtrata TaxID=2923435 RepID=A0ABS9V503_9BACT|nr:two-component regulator propeller domain-containing protein [Belliella filtrata]MCH7411491.1 response regulator [Belliella filtrata]